MSKSSGGVLHATALSGLRRCRSVTEPIAHDRRLTYSVEMTLPAAALATRDSLDQILHRRDRRVGVITSERGRGLYLVILTTADDDDAARSHALRLVTAALSELGFAELAPHIEVGTVTSQPRLPGGAHRVEVAPPLDYCSATLLDGRVVRAACTEPPGEWFAYRQDDAGRVLAGRALPDVLNELLGLPWSSEKKRWYYDALEALASHTTSHGPRYRCPCCDQLTLTQAPPGTNATCEVCGWEDDRVQFRDPDHRPGANRVSLREARENLRQLRLQRH